MPHPNDKKRSRLESDRSGWIYVLDNGMGHYKIGRTFHFKNRMKRLRIQLPFPVSVAYCFFDSDCIETEKNLHEMLGHKRMNGEWFALDLEDFEEIYAMAGDSGYWESRSGELLPDPFMPAIFSPVEDNWPDLHFVDEMEDSYEVSLVELQESARREAEHVLEVMREGVFNVE